MGPRQSVRGDCLFSRRISLTQRVRMPRFSQHISVKTALQSVTSGPANGHHHYTVDHSSSHEPRPTPPRIMLILRPPQPPKPPAPAETVAEEVKEVSHGGGATMKVRDGDGKAHAQAHGRTENYTVEHMDEDAKDEPTAATAPAPAHAPTTPAEHHHAAPRSTEAAAAAVPITATGQPQPLSASPRGDADAVSALHAAGREENKPAMSSPPPPAPLARQQAHTEDPGELSVSAAHAHPEHPSSSGSGAPVLGGQQQNSGGGGASMGIASATPASGRVDTGGAPAHNSLDPDAGTATTAPPPPPSLSNASCAEQVKLQVTAPSVSHAAAAVSSTEAQQ